MIYLTRKMHFSAAHRLYVDSLSPEENRKIFGECSNLHGHNYELEVTFAGEPDKTTGMVIHLSELDAIVKERVIDQLDHKNLDEDVDVFKTEVSTVEMLAKYVWDRLENSVPGARLHRVRIWEDDASFADFYGEGR
ncbi:MAG: 6-carboxytetrahydropterin synthase [Candidatus Latescibacterota bacterium]|nr:MAG: 6-carboxytetrahydropterin synthase [Candidatus Latescibacterota bacterium]